MSPNPMLTDPLKHTPAVELDRDNRVMQRAQEMTVTAPVSMVDPALQLFQRMVRDDSIPLDRIERILAMIDEREAVANRRAFNDALSRAQQEMKTIARDAANKETRSTYATLAAIDQAIRPIYSKHGLFPSFNTERSENGELWVKVTCELAHRGGHSRRYEIDMPADGKGPKGGDVMTRTHATGAAVSYGRRYLLQMIFNLSTADDDGNSAGLEPIDAAQLEELQHLIVDAGCDIALFCQVFGIEEVKALPARYFAEAKVKIATFKRRTEEAKAS